MRQKKSRGEKITMLTCYDYPTAIWEDEAGVDIIFVGDSVGTNVLGYSSEKEVTMADMAHHLRAVRRGVSTAYLLVDMPYGTTDSPEDALANAQSLLADGADGVKIEGPKKSVVTHLNRSGIEVCSHLGLTPQIDNIPGLRAKTASSALEFSKEVFEMEEAGASFILFESIPEEVAKCLTHFLVVPTIGIGAGRFTDGQVLVVLDLLGSSTFDYRHNQKYEEFRARAMKALANYVEDVETGRFPAEKNLRHLPEPDLNVFIAGMNRMQRTESTHVS